MATDHKLPDLKPVLGDVTAKNWKSSKPKIAARLASATKGKLAADADLEDVITMLDQLDDVTDEMADAPTPMKADGMMDPDEEALDGDAEMMEKVRAIIGPDADETKVKALCDLMKPAAGIDAEPPLPKPTDKPPMKMEKGAMDAAIAKMAKDNAAALAKTARETEEKTIARLHAIRDAERDVRPYIGELAMAQDSAADVYRLALDSLGVDASGVSEVSALKLILQAHPKPGETKAPPAAKARIGQDSAATASFKALFPNAVPLKSI
jgi:hypothetical protein